QEEESSEESTEETSGEGEDENENADQESAAEESTTEVATEEPPEEENGATDDETSADTNDYTAAERCIMSQLTECDGVSTSAQFQAYKDLVADGTLPQAPGSGCLPCAVKYSFEKKYGESRDIEAQPSGEPAEDESY